MSGWLELVVFILFILAFFAVSADNLRVRIQNRKLDIEVQRSIADYFLLAEEHSKSLQKAKEEDIEKTDGFLKFLSQSRDWAFEYIEAVQLSIKDLEKAAAKINLDAGYIVPEETEDLKKAVSSVLRHLPEEGKND